MQHKTGAVVYVNDKPIGYGGESIYELLRSLGIDPERPGVAVAVNAEVIPRSEWRVRRLGHGDRVEVVHAVSGG
ncbi:MAG TPA: sulfur carrier protein ThiS [Candidatus Caldiarchaeum subterraneum]|uniref:Sulfur carrier protein ThiS n=1 Tax=Caldiarchaeum subterraneum TaxID=311458 RepID=A0A832ZVW9_CALS0|nr:sulfur carrier protein ThiS [Aigarchaeota archaeon]HIQ29287.1 sulfur carrier protein ThiS [Candidatus Caldarchaeum subterraneum]